MNSVWLILSIGFNVVIFTTVIVFLVLGKDPSYYGPIGDSLGGFFGPIVGGASLYFIYQTLKEQRAAVFFLDITKKMDDLELDVNKITYKEIPGLINIQPILGQGETIYFGIEALRVYLAKRSLNNLEDMDSWNDNDDRFFTEIIQFTEKTSNLFSRVKSVDYLLIDSHKSDLISNFKKILNNYLFLIINIFYNLSFILDMKLGNENNVEFKDQILRLTPESIRRYNNAVAFVARYQIAIKIFAENELIQTEPFGNKDDINGEFKFDFFEKFNEIDYLSVRERGMFNLPSN